MTNKEKFDELSDALLVSGATAIEKIVIGEESPNDVHAYMNTETKNPNDEYSAFVSYMNIKEISLEAEFDETAFNQYRKHINQ